MGFGHQKLLVKLFDDLKENVGSLDPAGFLLTENRKTVESTS